MIHYIGILEKEPGSLWGIWFPDLPGCITAGESVETALDRAPDALRLWIACEAEVGREPPRARTIEELRTDPEFAEALAAGHAAIVVTLGEEALLGEDMLGAIDAAAERQGLTRQRFIRETLLEKVGS